MCSCPVLSGEVVCRSGDGLLRGPRSLVGACGGSRPHRKVLRRWNLQSDGPRRLVERGLDFRRSSTAGLNPR